MSRQNEVEAAYQETHQYRLELNHCRWSSAPSGPLWTSATTGVAFRRRDVAADGRPLSSSLGFRCPRQVHRGLCDCTKDWELDHSHTRFLSFWIWGGARPQTIPMVILLVGLFTNILTPSPSPFWVLGVLSEDSRPIRFELRNRRRSQFDLRT
jgi:hypothetical protein